jgi:hypothetical protein
MDSSLATLTARPRPFEVAGVTYQLHPLRIDDFGSIQAWCDSKQPNPYKSVSDQLGKGLFTVAQERALLEAAVRIDTAPKPQIGSPECDVLIASPRGMAKFMQLSIAHGDPKFTEAQALALVVSLDLARLEELTHILDFGAVIGGREEAEDGVPKVTGPGGGSTTPP